MMPKEVLLLASTGDEANRIASFCRRAFTSVTVHHGDWGQPLPSACKDWRGDLVISYCSRWIVPQYLLDAASFAAINFHPAPPTYPGVGGLNWALYNNESVFGVTCHHMSAKVDSGKIIETRYFPMLPSDDVGSLFDRTHLHLEALALDIMGSMSLGTSLPVSQEKWSETQRTRKELNELASISPDMPGSEIARRVRATNFGKWKPTVSFGGYTFELKT